jgi:pyruvate dehydrogenase E2 component (dihydrolipoamide acetyltransferase)
MPTDVIMPALELAQETGKILQWLKAPGDTVTKGEPIVEIETDKVTVEIEAPASGVLREVTARAGDVVPVGRTIALIFAPGEAGVARPAVPAAPGGPLSAAAGPVGGAPAGPVSAAAGGPASPAPGRPLSAVASPPAGVATSGGPGGASGAARTTPVGVTPGGPGGTLTGASPAGAGSAPGGASPPGAVRASPLARKVAEQHGVDLARVKTASGRIEKADVLAWVEAQQGAGPPGAAAAGGTAARLPAASPKARRLAAERGLDLQVLRGSGPGGAVLASDVPEAARPAAPGVGTVWRIMAERMTASWTTAPHFYLVREVNVGRLVAWRERASKQTGARITYTDLLVRLVAAALSRHPRANAAWKDGAIAQNAEVNVGLAVAIDDGLVVPVLHRADTLSLPEIAARREDLVSRAQAGKLRPGDIQGGGFTISNLGMYGVDAFSAIVNPPQAAILAVGRIADRVVAVNGQPAVQPTMVLTLSCDHRALDGARGAQFFGALAELIEEPLALLV